MEHIQRERLQQVLIDIILETTEEKLWYTLFERLMDTPPAEINNGLWMACDPISGVEWVMAINGPLMQVDLRRKQVVHSKPDFTAVSKFSQNGLLKPFVINTYVFIPGRHDPVPPMLFQGPGSQYTYRDPYGNYSAIPPDISTSILQSNGIEVWHE